MIAISSHPKNESTDQLFAELHRLFTTMEYVAILDMIQQAEPSLQGEDLGELYIMRAHVWQFLLPDLLLENLRQAKRLLPYGSRFPTAGSRFRTENISMFIFYNPHTTANALHNSIRKCMPLVQKLFGGISVDLTTLYEADLYYLTGIIDKAELLAKPVYDAMVKSSQYFVAITAACILVRCYTALGKAGELKEVMAQLERYANIRSRPRFRDLYTQISAWLNYTTGWLGEMPRFLTTPNGLELPVFEDRIYYYSQEHHNECGPRENALVEAGKSVVPDGVAVRDVVNGIFDAVVSFKLGKLDEAADTFYTAYSQSVNMHLMMPFAEYGRQILPLALYACESDRHTFSPRWIEKLVQHANAYEEGLRVIRGESRQQPFYQILSKPEMEMLQQMAQGATASDIASAMNIKVEEARSLIKDLYKKIGARNKSEAVSRFLEEKQRDRELFA